MMAKCTALLLVACPFFLFSGYSFAQTTTSFTRKVCRGSSSGLAHHEDIAESYRHYQFVYKNCTYVDGNLELVFFTDLDNYDFSFLQDIREITGYLLIVSVNVDVMPLTSLTIIRGRTLFHHGSRNYSLFVSNNYKPDHELSVGLRELRMPALHEIAAGHVFISNNPRLCYVHTVNWTDILPNPRFTVLINNTDTSPERCGHCSDQCEVLGGQRRCWAAASDMCQTYTYLWCSPQCDYRCRGPSPGDCCHQQCAAGCTGPSNAECIECRMFDNAGRCVSFCPPETIYSETEFKVVPNPDAKFSFGTQCVDRCPSYLIADSGACVHECQSGRRSNNEGICIPCKGPCPKRVLSACSPSDIQTCSEGFHSQLPPTDRTQFDQFCQRSATAESCLKKLDCGDNVLWKTTLGLMEGNTYLCSDDAREVFLKKGQCAVSEYGTAEAQRCLRKFSKNVQSLSIEQICRAMNEMLKCSYGVMKNRCGEDAARVFWTYLRRTSARSLASACSIDQSYQSQSAGNGSSETTVSMTSSVLLLIVSLLLIGR